MEPLFWFKFALKSLYPIADTLWREFGHGRTLKTPLTAVLQKILNWSGLLPTYLELVHYCHKITGSHTESFDISPELTQICYIDQAVAINSEITQLKVPAVEDTAEHRQNTSYLNRRLPDSSCCQDQGQSY